MQWNLRALFLLIAVVAMTFGVLRWFWDSTRPNHQLLLAFYLMLLSAIFVSAFPSNARFRGGLVGAVVFGLAYLAFVLKGGFGFHTLSEAKIFVRHVYMGLALLPVSFLLSQLCTMLIWQNERPTAERGPSP
jgi:hypothetical protein